MDYSEIAWKIKPGDVLAYGGRGGDSEIIKMATKSPVSHVGVIVENVKDYNRVLESATVRGFCGVSISFLRDRLKYYDGEVWWLPLKNSIPVETLFAFYREHDGKHYDMSQAIAAGIDALDWLGISEADEDYGRFFCSELVAAALKTCGAVHGINASEQTPWDVCRLGIYSGCHQLKGQPKPLNI